MMPTIPHLQVITVFSSGTKVKFIIEHKEFFDTMEKDKLRRLNMWIESDTDTPFNTYYKVTEVEYDYKLNKMKTIELTPTEERR